MIRTLFSIFLLLFSFPALAGIFEVSATGNYRRSQIDEFNYTTSTSFTASVSYYFLEMSAIELSYTNGLSSLSVRPTSSDPQQLYKTKFTFIGADLVLTFADRQSKFQPFVKIGAAHIEKEISLETEVGTVQKTPADPETVPSGGVGFKFKLTKTFSIKVGVDTWLTNMGEDDETFDYAGRAGLSVLF